MIRNSFYRVSLSNHEKLKTLLIYSSREKIPILFCLNHSNWWDAAFVVWLSIRYFKIDSYCLMELKQLQSNKFFNSLGAIPIVREDARQSLNAVKFASDIIERQNKALWIFPQGEIVQNDLKPYKFYSGITHVISSLEKVHLVNLFFEYRFTSEQRPEVFIDFFDHEIIENQNRMDKKTMIKNLEQKFESVHDSLVDKILRNDLKEFEVILQGKKSIDKKPD